MKGRGDHGDEDLGATAILAVAGMVWLIAMWNGWEPTFGERGLPGKKIAYPYRWLLGWGLMVGGLWLSWLGRS